ncbi:hypothetical protein HPP92_010564 [Vanilla planifolia]|uniref:Paladin n=1 Tax=Vanilla planifolia TaxID=51239 RepID=A0A835QU58_VANPL|nr:hypothetical protein HPP92_010564 [Vanilla planifolia]
MGALGFSTPKQSLMKIIESSDGQPCEMGLVSATRSGEVLGSQTVLKSDHCPGCQNLALPDRVEGAPNFRSVPGFPVYGVANPTVDGIRAVFQRISGDRGSRPVLWHNMREEPMLSRDLVVVGLSPGNRLFATCKGIDRDRVERMEARLKEDILREAERYGGAIMVIHETDAGQIFDIWEHITMKSVQTPLEVYKQLEYEGFPIKYARVPITDGKAPQSSDFDFIAANVACAPKDTAFVFNCQMGRGRTTTGTVIACLLKLRIDNGRPIKMQLEDVSYGESDGNSSMDDVGLGDNAYSVPYASKSTCGEEIHRAFGIDDILLLRKITRLFDNGVDCRKVLDAVIDRCSALQNIRQAVLQYRKVDGYPVYSMATPTVDGAREMLDYLGLKFPGNGDSSPKVVITDLREEAVIYVNGMPYVLRELDQPVDTLRHVGISGTLVQNIEARMKEDIYSEAAQSNGQILLHREEVNPATNRSIVVGFWERVSVNDVKTPAEVCAALREEGYNIEYRRIPLTREREASAADVDAIKYCNNECVTHHIFVSLTGHGGAAYAMVMACLGLDAQTNFVTGASNNSAPPSISLPDWHVGEESLKYGDYSDILSLTRVLIHGPKCKAEVDSIIERCALVGNIRDDILYYRKELQNCPIEDDETRAFLMDMGIKALRRYFFLITFRSYLYCSSPKETRFSAWMEARPELGHLCENLRLER